MSIHEPPNSDQRKKFEKIDSNVFRIGKNPKDSRDKTEESLFPKKFCVIKPQDIRYQTVKLPEDKILLRKDSSLKLDPVLEQDFSKVGVEKLEKNLETLKSLQSRFRFVLKELENMMKKD